MARFGFCGATYQSQSLNVDCERCINLYPEQVEGDGKSRIALYPSPGLKIAYNLGSTSILGQFSCQPAGSKTDRLFAVVQNGNNQTLLELFQNGASIQRGTILAPTTSIVTFAHNGTQMLICSGGNLWLFDLNANTLAIVAAAPANVSKIEYSDGFFIALIQNSNTFYLSALLDGTTWPALSKGQVSEFPDNVISMIVNQRIVLFQGRKASIPYSNAGALNVPFVPISGAFIENGAGAVQASVRLDNSVFFLDLDERGGAIARRMNGYTPTRVSNHAVENIWQSYPTVSDAIGYAFQDQGHSFWHLYFPSGISPDGFPTGASWRYDVATGLWHEVAFWNTVKGRYEAHRSQNHAYAWGMHFVGDYAAGIIYQMAIPQRTANVWSFADDAGAPIRRLRRAPVISKENSWIFHHEIQIDMESGLGPEPPLVGQQVPTVLTLQDPNGNLYSVTINDNGMIIRAAGSNQASPTVLVLNDPTLSTSWQLGIDIHGNLTTTQVGFNTLYPSSFLLVSTSGQKYFQFTVTAIGLLQTSQGGIVGRGPQIMLRWSDDHGHTWSNIYPIDCGQAGQYKKRVIKRRLGRSRNRVYEVTMTDPIPYRFVDGYVKASPGFEPTDRLVKQIGKGA